MFQINHEVSTITIDLETLATIADAAEIAGANALLGINADLGDFAEGEVKVLAENVAGIDITVLAVPVDPTIGVNILLGIGASLTDAEIQTLEDYLVTVTGEIIQIPVDQISGIEFLLAIRVDANPLSGLFEVYPADFLGLSGDILGIPLNVIG